MININRNNYEQYFVDYLDGNLSQQDEQQVVLFLEQNPDLKEELEEFEQIEIVKDEIAFSNKSSLKKQTVLSGLATNFDEICIASIEGDLKETQELELSEFIEANRDRQRDYDLFKLTKIPLDKTVVYSQKAELKKKERTGFKLHYAIYSAAASIILLIGLWILLPKADKQIQQQHIAEVKEEPKNSIEKQKETLVRIEKIDPISTYIKETKLDISRVRVEEIHVEANRELYSMPKIASLDVKVNTGNEIFSEQLANVKNKNYNTDNSLETNEKVFTVRSFLASRFNDRVLNKKDKDKIEWFDVAQASVEGFNKLAGTNMSLERKYDQNGNPDKTEFTSKLIAFSAPVKKD